MRHVTLLAALVFAAGCASTLPPDSSPSSSVTPSEATVPGKIVFGPEAAAAHPYFIRVQEQIAAKWGFPSAAQPFPPVPDEVARQSVAINANFRYRIEKK